MLPSPPVAPPAGPPREDERATMTGTQLNLGRRYAAGKGPVCQVS
jgi:hypothetical protein